MQFAHICCKHRICIHILPRNVAILGVFATKARLWLRVRTRSSHTFGAESFGASHSKSRPPCSPRPNPFNLSQGNERLTHTSTPYLLRLGPESLLQLSLSAPLVHPSTSIIQQNRARVTAAHQILVRRDAAPSWPRSGPRSKSRIFDIIVFCVWMQGPEHRPLIQAYSRCPSLFSAAPCLAFAPGSVAQWQPQLHFQRQTQPPRRSL